MSISKSESEWEEGRNAAQDALCLGDKFMKLAYKILEDELNASAPACINIQEMQGSTSHGYVTYGFGAHSVSLSKLAVMTSGLSGY